MDLSRADDEGEYLQQLCRGHSQCRTLGKRYAWQRCNAGFRMKLIGSPARQATINVQDKLPIHTFADMINAYDDWRIKYSAAPWVSRD